MTISSAFTWNHHSNYNRAISISCYLIMLKQGYDVWCFNNQYETELVHGSLSVFLNLINIYDHSIIL